MQNDAKRDVVDKKCVIYVQIQAVKTGLF